MTVTVRSLQPADAGDARRLGQEAFGVPPEPPTEPASLEQPGSHWYGAFSGNTLAAQMIDREFDSYFAGSPVATCGIAGVTVAAEFRGQRLLSPLFAETLRSAKARGAVVSTLFPTAPRIYRGFGYELVADFPTVEIPTHVLAAVAPSAGGDGPGRGLPMRARRAEAADVEAIRGVYDRWAREQNGPLSRRGISFDHEADQLLAATDGVTVAVDEAGVVCGYASWSRGQGFGPEAVLTVRDLLATSADSYRVLLRTLGSFSSVTGRTKINTSGNDLVRLFLPGAQWAVVDARPYMLKVLDVASALSRPCVPGLTAELRFEVAGDFLEENNGSYLLDVSHGQAVCRRESSPPHNDISVVTPRGLAQLYAGVQSAANLRVAGMLTGGDPTQDAVWDAVFGGRQAHIRNFF